MNTSLNNKRENLKALVATLASAALLAGSAQTASANDREWATAGKILTGVVADAVVARVIEPAPVYAYQTTAYYAPLAPPVYRQAPPVVVYAPSPRPLCFA